MNLLTSTMPQIQRILRNPSCFSALLICLLATFEILGRKSPSDFHDTIAATLLFILGVMVARQHQVNKLRWLEWLSGKIWNNIRRINRFNIDLGLDLRGDPPIKRRVPAAVLLVLCLLASSILVAIGVWKVFPTGWRDPFIHISYLMYLAFCIVLWSIVSAGIVLAVALPMRTLSLIIPRLGDYNNPRTRLHLLILFVAYLCLVVLATSRLPIGIPLAILYASLVLIGFSLLLDNVGSVSFLWRPVGTYRVFTISTKQAIGCILGCGYLLLTSCILFSSGNRIFASIEAEQSMPITVWMGLLLAWLMPGLILSTMTWLFVFTLRNPARPAIPRLYLVNRVVGKTRLRLDRACRKAGWLLTSAPLRRTNIDVPIRLCSPAKSEANEFMPRWPMRVCINDLELGMVFERFARKSELKHRKLLRIGFERLFSSLTGQNFKSGHGFWMAPHLWLQPGLARDEEMETMDGDRPAFAKIVGPLYRDLFPRSSRYHLYQMMRKAKVDVIFIEDGIKFQGFWRVVKALFDTVDKSNGQTGVHETSFHGIPKIRVMIHDLQLDMPFESNTYPEPKFELLGRARVLHIFKDRGDQEEWVEPPVDFSFNPMPIRGA